MRTSVLPILALAILPLGGCVYAAAAGALGSAVKGAGSGNRAAPDPAGARIACTAQAERHGTVHIIDTLERGGTVRVYGTVQSGRQRQSFQCDWRGTQIRSFELRPLPPAPGA